MNIKLTQIKSSIGTTQIQKDNLRSLSLGKIGRVSFFNDSDKAFLGRLQVIRHLVSVEKI